VIDEALDEQPAGEDGLGAMFVLKESAGASRSHRENATIVGGA
jgi:hypothetical protein